MKRTRFSEHVKMLREFAGDEVADDAIDEATEDAALQEYVQQEPIATFSVPVRAPSTPNLREHWAVRAKRADSQKRAARACCPPWTRGPLLVVRMTRVAPRALDSDNLAAALKSVRDGLATWLRVDDASPLVRWEYAQAKGEPRVEIEVEAA